MCTSVRFLLTVSSTVSDQRAAIDRGVRTLTTPVRLLTWQDTTRSRQLTAAGCLVGVCYLCTHVCVTCVRPQVLQQRGPESAAVWTVWTGEWSLSSVDAQVTPQRQFRGELPVDKTHLNSRFESTNHSQTTGYRCVVFVGLENGVSNKNTYS